MFRLRVLSEHVVAGDRSSAIAPCPSSSGANVKVYPPKKKHFVTNPWERLARHEGDGGATKAETVPAVFMRRVASHGPRDVLAQKRGARDGPWTKWTWNDYGRDVRTVAKALMALGCNQHDAINILAFNSPEWFEVAIGGIFAGLTPAGIYGTNGVEAVEYILNHSKARVIFVDNDVQLKKVLANKAKCKHLEHIVHWGADCPKATAGVLSWQEFMALGDKVSEQELEARIASMQPDNACYLSYTSGTTGHPKAVMYSHDNILWSFKYIQALQSEAAGGMNMDEREVSYMPLSHIAGNVQLLGAICVPQDANICVHFAFPDAMQGSLPDTLREVRPTSFLGVPRVWEKFALGLGQLLQAKPELKKDPAAAKAFLGLDKVKSAVTGAAPIADDIMKLFDSLELPIYEVYGMTENSAYSHFNRLGKRRIGSVGPAMCDEGAGYKIAAGSGEICTWSRGLMMGYMYAPEKTLDAFDDDGFLRTGDIGEEREGFLHITGRIKEMIITAGGENMAPVLLEQELKEQMPALSNIVMIGDRQKYLVSLITLKLVPNATGGFTNQLDPAAVAVDPSCKTWEDAQKSQIWAQYLAKGVERANEKAISRAQATRRYVVLPGDFSPVGDVPELTPTMKLKRDVVLRKFLAQIKQTYGEDWIAVPGLP